MGAQDVVVVGAGRVGVFLAATLAAGIVTRSPASRARAAAAGLAPLALADADAAGTLLLAVADDELPGLVDQLVVRGGGAGRFVAHTSGRHGLDVLRGLASPVAAVHPAMTFTGSPADLERAGEIVYAVTAEGEGLARARALVRDLGGRVALVADAHRAAYHAAMSHAANHLVTLVADAGDLLRAAGIEDTAALLRPITTAALSNVLVMGDAALTGPVVRGDVGTVAAHLAALAGSPQERSYRAMARRTAERAAAAGRLDAGQAAAILALLDENTGASGHGPR